MRWLLIGLLVSLGVLLFAAAGVTCHILIQRQRLRKRSAQLSDPTLGPAEGNDIEPES